MSLESTTVLRPDYDRTTGPKHHGTRTTTAIPTLAEYIIIGPTRVEEVVAWTTRSPYPCANTGGERGNHVVF